jgi:hypothetical protein
MRNLLIALAGFLAGSALVVGLLLALPRTATVTIKQSARPVATNGATEMMNGGTMSSATRGSMMAAYYPAAARLTIQHVQKGCHVWSNGTRTGTMLRLHLKVGQRLAILDQDVDAHQMLQFAGPTHMNMGGPMMMGHGTTISFAQKGVYRLGTKTVPMPGAMDVKTIGPDNSLRLVVTVA